MLPVTFRLLIAMLACAMNERMAPARCGRRNAPHVIDGGCRGCRVGSGIRSHRMCDKPTNCDLSDDALALT
jgi:hypothetical protein